MSNEIPDQHPHHALLTLLLLPGLGPTRVGRLLDAMGSPQHAIQALREQPNRWHSVSGISTGLTQRANESLKSTRFQDALSRERDSIQSLGVQLLAIHDPDYPAMLRHIPDPPPLLWVRGEIVEADALSLGMVGARRCSHYGREQANRLAGDVVRAGLTVISGGAYGIDAAAHQGALQAGGRTLAVIGSGLANPYPKDHIALFDSIASPGAGCGAVISELPMSVPPKPENFPRRNRLISGLSLGVLVLEAAVRSGALITARLCVEEHGRICMALPGRVDSPSSAGCHKILREGWAQLVTNATDILHALQETGTALEAQVAAENAAALKADPIEVQDLFSQSLSSAQQQIVRALDRPRALDDLVAATGIDPGTLRGELTMLEIAGRITRQGGSFSKATKG